MQTITRGFEFLNYTGSVWRTLRYPRTSWTKEFSPILISPVDDDLTIVLRGHLVQAEGHVLAIYRDDTNALIASASGTVAGGVVRSASSPTTDPVTVDATVTFLFPGINWSALAGVKLRLGFTAIGSRVWWLAPGIPSSGTTQIAGGGGGVAYVGGGTASGWGGPIIPERGVPRDALEALPVSWLGEPGASVINIQGTIKSRSIVGVAESFIASIVARGPVAPTYSWSKVSGPGAVTFGSSTAASTAVSIDAEGSYVLRCAVGDGLATADFDFSVTVSASPPPSIDSVDPISIVAYQAYVRQLIARNTDEPVWSASGLPPGLTIGAGTGIISGSPNSAGSFVANITLTDGADVDSIQIAFTVSETLQDQLAAAGAPQIGLPAAGRYDVQAEVGLPFNFGLGASGSPTSWTASGLPPGLSINQETGWISGTPVAAGLFVVAITPSNDVGAGTTAYVAITVTRTDASLATLDDFCLDVWVDVITKQVSLVSPLGGTGAAAKEIQIKRGETPRWRVRWHRAGRVVLVRDSLLQLVAKDPQSGEQFISTQEVTQTEAGDFYLDLAVSVSGCLKTAVDLDGEFKLQRPVGEDDYQLYFSEKFLIKYKPSHSE